MNSLKIARRIAVAFLFTAIFSFTAKAQENEIPKLTDAEIASVAVTANQIDVDYGKLALKKANDAEAKKFAQTMIDDHTSIINQAVALATKLGVTPKTNDVTKSLLEGAAKTTKELESKKGKDFNKAYIDNEVAYHEAVISAIKNILIPQTQNAELKALLVKVMPLLNHHFEMAKMAQSKIN